MPEEQSPRSRLVPGPAAPTSPSAIPHLDARALFGQSVVAMMHLTPGWVIRNVNQAMVRQLEVPTTRLVGGSLRTIVHDEDQALLADAARALQQGGHHTLDLRLQGRQGIVRLRCAITAFTGDDDRPADLVLQAVPVPAAARRAVHVQDQANIDPLTGLVTRGLFMSLLAESLATSDEPMAVVAINLDRFKSVNDARGHAVGDGVLSEIAARLGNVTKSGDVIARAGGDDYLLLLGDVGTRPQAGAIARRLLAAIAAPMSIEQTPVQVTASLGVALVTPEAELSADQVLTRANAGLAVAKRRGRARFELYDSDVARDASNRLRLEHGLREALDEERLDIAYQPIRDLATGTLAGAEALVRWQDPRLGNVPPEHFMPIAEESGLVEPVTTFVLETAVADAARWRATTLADVYVAVNLSAQDLARRDLAGQVAEVLGHAGLPPRALRIEIVETVLVEAGERVRGNLSHLRELGVVLGIDDFGSGYSSLTYLKYLPVDFIKVDRSFITGLGVHREDTAIVRAIIALAKSLDLGVVAEGIENPTQMRLLRELGCDMGQGFLIGHADTADELARWLAAEEEG